MCRSRTPLRQTAQTPLKRGGDNVRNTLHKATDIICILLELAFAIISLPFKLIKAIFDIAAVVKKETA